MIKPAHPLKETALKTWVSLLVIIGTVLGLLFVYSIRSVVLDLVVAIILAIAVTPVVRFLMKRGMNRAFASIVAVVITLIVLLGIIAAIASPLISQSNELIHNAPKLLDKIDSNPFIKQLNSQYHIIDSIKDYTKELPTLLGTNSGNILSAVGSVFEKATTTVVVFVLTLFLLIEGPSTWVQFIRLLGVRNGAFVNNVAKKIQVAVGGYVSGNLFISLIAGIVALIALVILRVPYPIPLAALVAIFDLIPLIGATLATIVLALVALTKGLFVAVILVAIMLIYQFLEGHLIQPIVYGRTVKLSQLLIIVATIVGALLGGIIGVLLAIPVAAAVVIVITEVLRANGADVDADKNAALEGPKKK